MRNIKVPRETFTNFIETICMVLNHVRRVSLSSEFLSYFSLDQEVSILRWEECYEKIRRFTVIS